MSEQTYSASGLVITHCVHGLDMRLNPRCYLCTPEVPMMRVVLPRRRGGFLSPLVEGTKDALAEFGLWGRR